MYGSSSTYALISNLEASVARLRWALTSGIKQYMENKSNEY